MIRSLVFGHLPHCASKYRNSCVLFGWRWSSIREVGLGDIPLLNTDSFYADFGPLNLAMLYKYCSLLCHILKVAVESAKFCFLTCFSSGPCEQTKTDLSHHADGPPQTSQCGLFDWCLFGWIILDKYWSDHTLKVIYLGRTPEAAYKPLAGLASSLYPFRFVNSIALALCSKALFRDASYGSCLFKLTVSDCLRGIFQV